MGRAGGRQRGGLFNDFAGEGRPRHARLAAAGFPRVAPAHGSTEGTPAGGLCGGKKTQGCGSGLPMVMGGTQSGDARLWLCQMLNSNEREGRAQRLPQQTRLRDGKSGAAIGAGQMRFIIINWGQGGKRAAPGREKTKPCALGELCHALGAAAAGGTNQLVQTIVQAGQRWGAGGSGEARLGSSGAPREQSLDRAAGSRRAALGGAGDGRGINGKRQIDVDAWKGAVDN